ncbi:DUF4430 domain-containing protein [Ectobacillus funiculus]|uniref:DUF4430 domain-containing protein n=1 Tax=Ectobacillus funiculus TaxID=137993 RepID=A0ABV5W9G6_9BACI
MRQLKKWMIVSLTAIMLVAVSFVNTVHTVFAETANTITLAVVGDAERKVILCPKEVAVQPDETALDVLKREFPNGIVTEQSSFGEYLTGVDGLLSGGENPNSYWSFEVNGAAANVGADAYKVHSGDTVAFRYVTDWNVGLGNKTLEESIAELGGCEEQSEPAAPTTPDQPGQSGPTDGNSEQPGQSGPTDGNSEQPGQSDSTDGESGQPGKTDENSAPVLMESVNKTIDNAVQFMLSRELQSDWEVIGVLQSAAAVSDEAKATYLKSLEDRVNTSARLNNMALARTILAINALGADPTNFAGQNLVSKLYNDETVGSINSYIYALLALDSRDYEIPSDAKWTRDSLISEILKEQHADGGWSFSSETGDPDMTGMVLTALAPYKSRAEVKPAIDNAVSLLKTLQTSNGGYESDGVENANSAAQVVTGLAAIGVDPAGSEFTKDGHTLIQNLQSFQLSDGSFKWLSTDSESSSLASEQALYALVQYKFYTEGKGSIFHWTGNPVSVDNGSAEETASEDSESSNEVVTVATESPAASAEASSTENNTHTEEIVTVASSKETTTTPVSAASASKKQKLPDTAMFGTETIVMTAAGAVLMTAGAILWRRKKAA